MAGASAAYHEPSELLSPETIECHRGLVSLMEELEAIDWYSQRIDAAGDDALKAVLAHNRDEEKEHAMMTLEWLRRRDPALDGHMRRYLFTEGDIADAEEDGGEAEAADGAAIGDGSLAIGSLRGARP